MQITFKLKRYDSADWAFENPILESGEPGFEKDTGRLRIGDGKTPFMSLDWFMPSAEVTAEIQALAAPDDGPSFLLLYENAKV